MDVVDVAVLMDAWAGRERVAVDVAAAASSLACVQSTERERRSKGRPEQLKKMRKWSPSLRLSLSLGRVGCMLKSRIESRRAESGSSAEVEGGRAVMVVVVTSAG